VYKNIIKILEIRNKKIKYDIKIGNKKKYNII